MLPLGNVEPGRAWPNILTAENESAARLCRFILPRVVGGVLIHDADTAISDRLTTSHVKGKAWTGQVGPPTGYAAQHPRFGDHG